MSKLKLVSSFEWIDFDWLAGSEQEIQAVLDQAGEYMDKTRKDAILSAYASRLEQLMESSQRQMRQDRLEQDVESDIMQDYTMERP